MLHCIRSARRLLQHKEGRCGRGLSSALHVVHRRSKMVVAGILSVLTVAGLAMILTAWKTGLVE